MSSYVESPRPLYEDDPTVFMDASLGRSLKSGQVIDLDYDAYHGMVDEISGRHVSLAGVAIDITRRLPLLTNGDCNLVSETIRVKPAGKNFARTQKFLQHETQHLCDLDSNLRIYEQGGNGSYGLALKTMNPALATGTVGAAGIVGAVYAPRVFPDNETLLDISRFVNENEVSVFALPVIAIGIAAAGLVRYSRAQFEIRARKAEKLDFPRVISIKQS